MTDAPARAESVGEGPVGEFAFPYVDSLLYAGLLIGLMAGWFALSYFLERLLAPLGGPALLVVLVFVGGFAAGYFLLRRGLARAYTFAGKAIVWKDRLRLVLRGKPHDVAFDDIKRVSYRRKRTEKGFIFSAKKLSLYLEEAPKPLPGIEGKPAGLFEFYEALERETRIYQMVKEMKP